LVVVPCGQDSGGGAPAVVVAGAVGLHGTVVFSSAVPVLPATVTPGMAALRPVPPATTPTIMRRIWWATRGVATRGPRAVRPLLGMSVNGGRRPPRAIAAAIEVICRTVAWTLPCPIAEAPTARSSPISFAPGIVLVAAPATSGGRLKP